MRQIILDTSFVVKCVEFGIDMFEELKRVMPVAYELVYLDKSLEELKSVQKQGGKEKQYVKIAKIFLTKAKKIVTIEEEHVDDILLRYAKKHKAVLATQDFGLKRRARKKSLSVVCIRQKKFLVGEGI